MRSPDSMGVQEGRDLPQRLRLIVDAGDDRHAHMDAGGGAGKAVQILQDLLVGPSRPFSVKLRVRVLEVIEIEIHQPLQGLEGLPGDQTCSLHGGVDPGFPAEP